MTEFVWNMVRYIVRANGQYRESGSVYAPWLYADHALANTSIPLAFRRALRAALEKLRNQ